MPVKAIPMQAPEIVTTLQQEIAKLHCRPVGRVSSLT